MLLARQECIDFLFECAIKLVKFNEEFDLFLQNILHSDRAVTQSEKGLLLMIMVIDLTQLESEEREVCLT
jgi:hypothetical protein